MNRENGAVLLGGFGEKLSNGGDAMVFPGQGLFFFRNGRVDSRHDKPALFGGDGR